MTRPTGEDEMIDMTDERAAEVLAAMRQDGGTVDDADWIAAIDHAVSRLRSQPPAECSSFTAGDMADAAAQGFRDGVASVEAAAVDGAMVERACKAAVAQCAPDEVWPDDYRDADDLRAMMQAALTAALELQQGGRSDD